MAKSNHLMALMSLWGVMLVILGHSGFEEPLVAENLHWLDTWIYMFHMPLFFFISGYLYSLTNKDFTRIESKKFLKKKFVRLYVPYLVLGVIIFCIKFGMSGFMGSSRIYSFQDFLMMFIAPRWPNSTMGYLWFIGTMFFMFVIITLMGKIKADLRKQSCAIIVIVIFWMIRFFIPEMESWTTIFNLQGLLWFMPFFIIGIHYQMNETQYNQYTEGGKAKSIFLFVFTILGAWLIIENFFAVFLVKIVFAIIGIFFSIVLCNTLLGNEFVKNHLLPFGDITYTIYLLSFFGQYFAKVLVVNLLHLSWPLWVVFMFVGGVVFPLFIYKGYKVTNGFGGNKFLKIIIGLS